jgi:hypothetical protein
MTVTVLVINVAVAYDISTRVDEKILPLIETISFQ